MACIDKPNSACPFAFTEMSERVQNYGCLPIPADIIRMRVKYSKTWACHSEPTKPCKGAIRHLRNHKLPYTVIDSNLVTEKSNWEVYT